MKKFLYLIINPLRTFLKIFKEKKVLYFLLAIIIFLLIALTIYFYRKSENLESELKQDENSESIGEIEVERIVELLGKHVLLPEETPVIYIISSPQEAKTAYGDFFSQAIQGDYLIVYSNKAIIYRESTDLIINTGPVVFPSDAQVK